MGSTSRTVPCTPGADAALCLRACLKIPVGLTARDFGCGRGGATGASPPRAVTFGPTKAPAERPAASPAAVFRQALSHRPPPAKASPVGNLSLASSLPPWQCHGMTTQCEASLRTGAVPSRTPPFPNDPPTAVTVHALGISMPTFGLRSLITVPPARHLTPAPCAEDLHTRAVPLTHIYTVIYTPIYTPHFFRKRLWPNYLRKKHLDEHPTPLPPPHLHTPPRPGPPEKVALAPA